MEEYKEHIEQFKQLLHTATASISSKYFHLPIYNQSGEVSYIYRERVYCYELYYCLRSLWQNDYPFSLGGEVDKSGHPLYGETPVAHLKPDLLVHTPGDPNGNLIVLEVKPVNALRSKIQKDLCSLAAFLQYANYQKAIYVVYGNDEHAFNNFRSAVTEFISNGFVCGENTNIRPETIDPNKFEFYWHNQFNRPAVLIPINNSNFTT